MGWSTVGGEAGGWRGQQAPGVAMATSRTVVCALAPSRKDAQDS